MTIKAFFKHESTGGIVLLAAALLAILLANSPLAPTQYALQKHLLFWINDGLMVVFFFLIGLELKREILEGALSTRAHAALPLLAAVGGVALPACLYMLVNHHAPANLPGWAIPCATDIAFALCVFNLAGKHAPVSLKTLLLAIAIADDLAAILIIALFYGHAVHPVPLAFAGAFLTLLFLCNRRNVTNLFLYGTLAFALWVAVFQSGLHATLAGVLAAFFVPLRDRENPSFSPSITLEHHLHPWVSFLVLPLFGLANAGVPLTGIGLHNLADPLMIGIALGLLLGKPAGVFAVIFLAVKTGLCPKPADANWRHIFAVSLLCGIGFTMALFIGGLAFPGPERQTAIRLGILGASFLAAGAGYGLLRFPK